MNDRLHHIEKTYAAVRLDPAEQSLNRRIAEGDELAFTDLFNHYYGQLHPFVQRFTGSRADAEEVLQETFIRVWLNRDKLPGIVHLRNWIFTIAANLCLIHIRKSLSTHHKENSYGRKQMSISCETPADSFDYAEINHLIGEAVDRMPPQRQLIYRMSREEGLKPGEIAHQLGLSPSTVKNTLVTSLKDIRDYLLESGHLISLVLLIYFF